MSDDEYRIIAATQTLALIESQVEEQRAELTRLRRDLTLAQRELARARRDLVAVQLELVPSQRNLAVVLRDWNSLQLALKSAQKTHLLDVNEQLVLAALTADTIAETALMNFKELSRISQRDPLTDTPNRALMLDRMDSAIALARRNSKRVAVVFIDFDRFKQINDSLGHEIGDAALKLVARRLESVVRDTDTVSRHSGDEFLVLLAEVGQIADVAAVAEKMLAVFEEPAQIGSHLLTFSASIGIAFYPEDAADSASLINLADAAMYRAKNRGGNCFELSQDGR